MAVDDEEGSWDLVVVGTGYVRDGHWALLRGLKKEGLLEDDARVERNYQVRMKRGMVDSGCGIWLQGCCEESHGVS